MADIPKPQFSVNIFEDLGLVWLSCWTSLTLYSIDCFELFDILNGMLSSILPDYEINCDNDGVAIREVNCISVCY